MILQLSGWFQTWLDIFSSICFHFALKGIVCTFSHTVLFHKVDSSFYNMWYDSKKPSLSLRWRAMPKKSKICKSTSPWTKLLSWHASIPMLNSRLHPAWLLTSSKRSGQLVMQHVEFILPSYLDPVCISGQLAHWWCILHRCAL